MLSVTVIVIHSNSSLFGAFPQVLMGFEGHRTQACVKAHSRGGSREGKPRVQAPGERGTWIFSFGNLVNKRAFRTVSEPQVGRVRDSLRSVAVFSDVLCASEPVDLAHDTPRQRLGKTLASFQFPNQVVIIVIFFNIR